MSCDLYYRSFEKIEICKSIFDIKKCEPNFIIILYQTGYSLLMIEWISIKDLEMYGEKNK